jgi:hypothetical protein
LIRLLLNIMEDEQVDVVIAAETIKASVVTDEENADG